MKNKRYKIVVSSHEYETLLRAVSEGRNACIDREVPCEDIDDIFQKLIDAPQIIDSRESSNEAR